VRIALDAMGGDFAPRATVEGALLAVRGEPRDFDVVLVGRQEAIAAELKRLGVDSHPRLEIVHASQVAGMDEAPSLVLRRKRDASVRVCFDLHKKGEVDAVVSAGNSGATMAVGMMVMGRLPEVDRPALASVFPGLHGPTVLIDVGANVDCTPLMLLQFGYMGAVYAERVVGIADPKVGLLSIGEETSKGNTLVRHAHENFKASALNFIGNVEGRDLFLGRADVVVCDGFVGNVCLKVSEGLAEALLTMLMEELKASMTAKVGGMLLRGALRRLFKRMDYATYGGAPLLGINGVGFISHGASSPKAIASALRVAASSVREGLVEHIKEGLARYRGRLLGEAAQGR